MAGAGTLRTECSGEQVRSQPDCTDSGNAKQPPRAQMVVLIDAGNKPDAAKNQRNARQCGNKCADQPRDDQRAGDDIQPDIHLAMLQFRQPLTPSNLPPPHRRFP